MLLPPDSGHPIPAMASTVIVTEKDAVADGVVSLVLEHPGGGRLPDWSPGAHIDLHLPGFGARQYSLCGDRWDPGRYRIAVLRERSGRGGSAFIHDRVAVGDHLGLGGPRNNFVLHPSPRYVFIAGGIGITPLLPMLDQADRIGAQWELLYGGRTSRAMAFAPRLTRTYPGRVRLAPQDEAGLLDLAFLEQPQDAVVYTCGPSPLLEAVRRATATWSPHRIRTERFTPRDQGVPALDGPFTVELARQSRTVQVPPMQSVLDALRSAGIPALTSCGQGTCGTCEVTVLQGLPDHRDSILDESERETSDRMFICVSRSRTEKLVLDL